ncbi:MAG: hypothetical protein ACKOBM_16770, partial [Gammaproteobacteria bacterium]
MTDDFRSIRPKQVALTRSSEARPTALEHANDGRRSRVTTAAVLSAIVALLVVAFVIAPRVVSRPDAEPQTAVGDAAEPQATPTPPAPASDTASDPASGPAPGPAPASGPTGASASGPSISPAAGATNAPGSAPYAEQTRERAREAAQAALSRFVELELRVQAEIRTEPWGDARLTDAKTLAAAGDDAFMRNVFLDAAKAYDAGADLLDALLQDGRAILADGLARGAAALAARDAAAALAAFQAAAGEAPADPRVVAGLARSASLPEVNARLRSARNHELAGNWDAALADLDAAGALDPATEGLAALRDRIVAAASQSQLQLTLSQAFGHMDAGADDAARAAFQAALRIDPGNPAAQGGLEALSRNAEARRLTRLERDATAALAAEDWDRADQLFGEALAIDANVQFAVAGRAAARAQRSAEAALLQVLNDPDRLSSATAYRDAEAALATAMALATRGPRLESRIAS